ncbi:MAG: CotH kinase family protein [Clostridia bacterium]|nr:CotH kinase family protein [Clostridia bacterium]
MKRWLWLLLLLPLVFSGCEPADGDPSGSSSSEVSDPTDVTDATDVTDSLPSSELTDSRPTDSSSESTETSSEPTDPPVVEGTGTLVSLSLLKSENPLLQKDLHFVIDEEHRTATLTLDYQGFADISTLRSAVLSGKTEGGSLLLETDYDGTVCLIEDSFCTVVDDLGNLRVYTLKVNRVAYQIPVISITLSDGTKQKDIPRDETVEMTFTMDGSPVGAEEIFSISGTIRGRGHSTWKWDKKPYKIKFDEKVSILGMTENKDWILLANFADKSLIRNTLAYEMGRVLDGLTWSPHQYPVDLFINGVYCGVYSIGEHMEVASGRVELTEGSEVDVGYLIEVGGMENTDTMWVDGFHTDKRLVKFAAYKSPDRDEITSAQRAYIREYFQLAEDAIVAGVDYEQYIDVDSFVDWIILHELAYNLDACFRRSCYLMKPAGGKLQMGPIWDFDLAFGNFSQDEKTYDNWITVGSSDSEAYIAENWCTYLMKDPAFRKRLKARWEEVRDELLTTANQTIDKYSALLDGSQQENFAVWKIWGKRAGYQSKWCSAANTYEKQIKYLKDFLTKRAAWIDKHI